MFSINVYNYPDKSEMCTDYNEAIERAIQLRDTYKSDIFVDYEITDDTIDHFYKP